MNEVYCWGKIVACEKESADALARSDRESAEARMATWALCAALYSIADAIRGIVPQVSDFIDAERAREGAGK